MHFQDTAAPCEGVCMGLMMVRASYIFSLLESSPRPCELNFIVPISQMGSGHTESFSLCPQDHTAEGPHSSLRLFLAYSVNSCHIPSVQGEASEEGLCTQEAGRLLKDTGAHKKL